MAFVFPKFSVIISEAQTMLLVYRKRENEAEKKKNEVKKEG
jgi:hypothetical protein